MDGRQASAGMVDMDQLPDARSDWYAPVGSTVPESTQPDTREPGTLDERRGCGALGKLRRGAAGDYGLQPQREVAEKEKHVIEAQNPSQKDELWEEECGQDSDVQSISVEYGKRMHDGKEMNLMCL